MIVIRYTSISPNFILIFKRNKRKCNFHYTAMPLMTSQMFKFVDFAKSRYLENETLFFLQIKKIITYKNQRLLYARGNFS